jgi:hypothetical protein
MPGSAQKQLTAAQARRLQRATARIDEARREWARLVREFGVAASARELGLSARSVSERVRRIEARANDEDDRTVLDVILERNPSVAGIERRPRRSEKPKD